jgi:deazaflavin-dependent oxidoreductase (nitroreductase family)
MPGERDWNAEVIAEFRANQGQVAAPYDDPPPMLLLHTVGARSGREHVVPMRCLPDGDRLYVFASAHGSARNPDWYHNVIAHPDFDIEMGAERGAERGIEVIPVHATEVQGTEREAIFNRHAARFPIFAEYQRALQRAIPVLRLERRSRAP